MANFHSINGNEVEAHYAGGDLREEIDLKADSDGYYTMLTAGAADNLTARGDGVTASFLYRTTAGSASVPDEGEATVRSIKGRTLVWNQLVSGATASVENVQHNNFVNVGMQTSNPAHIINGHKYLGMADFTLAGDALNASIYLTTSSAHGYACNTGAPKYMFTADADRTAGFYFRVNASSYPATFGGSVANFMLFDLTQMFGAGNEPSTVAEFEALFPLPYYEYDAGSLLSVNMEGIETVGFNQWDEEWEKGYISDSTGENNNTASANYLRSKNHIPVFPGMAYHFTRVGTNGMAGKVYYYDADKAYLSFDNVTFGGNDRTPPANARYMRFWTNYAGNYNNDICINLSWSGYRNGEYEPYWSEQRVIAAIAENFPDGMRSAGSVADELTNHEAIHRVGAVDLGTLTWTYSNGFFRTSDLNSVILRPANNNTPADAKCSKYEIASWNSETDKSVMVGRDAVNPLLVKDTSYTDAATFKSAMDGVMLHYALATPTTTPFPQPISMNYKFADFGTERVMVPTGQMSAPPTMDVAYGLNATDTLRTLPTEYISKASDASFTAALGAFLNATITRTWDETNQRYDYTITANGE